MYMTQIAEAVGIKAPSLYKHYKSKQDIFDALLEKMEKRYKEQASAMQMDGTIPQIDAPVFQNLSAEGLVETGRRLFLYFLHDPYVSRFRKMLTIEQYQSQNLSVLYTKQYTDDPLNYQSMVLGLLAQAGILRQEDLHIMAIHFYAPLYLILTLCDRQPEKEKEALETLEKHIVQFIKLYRN